jgi:tripartite-type tricarboxylate transporter receptor subunit TctC
MFSAHMKLGLQNAFRSSHFSEAGAAQMPIVAIHQFFRKRAMIRKLLAGILTAAGIIASTFPQAALSADYPDRPVRIIVPVAAGGGSDILARVIADKLSAMWPQRVFIDNRPGAGHMLGTALGARSEPDGYTMMMVGLPHVVNPSLHENMRYRAEDFDPVILLAQVPIVLVAHPETTFRSVADLIAAAKAKPGEISYASTGQNGSGQLAGELLKITAKISMVHVPYKGSSEALQDVLTGRVPVMFDALVTALPHIQAGKLRPLSVSVTKRTAELPSIPTMEEAGYPGFVVSGWLGLLVPKGTPGSIIDKLNADIAAALRQPDVVAKLRSQTWEILPIGSTKDAFASFLRTEETKWASVVKTANLKGD